MRQRIPIGTWILAVLLMSPLAALAQIPGGVQVPGTSALPSASLPTKDGLLQQAKGMVTDLTAMKSSGKLAPAQVQQVDGLLPKATALTSDLQKPQIPTSKLAEYATTLNDLQKQVGMLKSAIK
jgi:hypothetical protein